MRFTITDNRPPVLLSLAIKDICCDYESADNPQEADAIVTLEELQANILEQLDGTLSQKEREFITLDFLRSELKNNNLVETLIAGEDGIREVWFLKKIAYKNNA